MPFFSLAFHRNGSDLQNFFQEVCKPLFNSFDLLHSNVFDSVPCLISYESKFFSAAIFNSCRHSFET
jgi:hypothetical protein